jgi:hypothetical protein
MLLNNKYSFTRPIWLDIFLPLTFENVLHSYLVRFQRPSQAYRLQNLCKIWHVNKYWCYQVIKVHLHVRFGNSFCTTFLYSLIRQKYHSTVRQNALRNRTCKWSLTKSALHWNILKGKCVPDKDLKPSPIFVSDEVFLPSLIFVVSI